MKIKNVALIVRKLPYGGVLIFGKGVEVQKEISDRDDDDGDYLILGGLELDDKHIFNEYNHDKGNSPDKLLLGGGLDHKNYKKKIK